MKTTQRSRNEIIGSFQGNPHLTRLEIQEKTGFSRVTISQNIQNLISTGLLVPSNQLPSNGGRKATSLSLNPTGGFVGICYFSATSLTVAIANLVGEITDSLHQEINISDGPNENLPLATQWLSDLFKKIPKSKRLGVLIGVPGPVAHESGRVVSPPIMQGWDSINISGHFEKAFGIPAYLENDVNLMTLAEHRLVYPDVDNLLLVKLGTGIGSGIIIGGRLHRGAEGSAGDIGHVQLDALKGSLCRCGHNECVESFAGGWALVGKVKELGYSVDCLRDIANIARQGDVTILRLLTEASSYVGHAIALAVNLLNPSKVVVVGRTVDASDRILAVIKEVVYQRAAALATKNLEIVPSRLPVERGLLGAAQLGLDKFFFENAEI